MTTLATAARTVLTRLFGHSPQSTAGFGPVPQVPLPRLGPLHVPTHDVPIGVDENGLPVYVPRYEHLLIAGDPRTMVTTALRTVAVHHARFPATRIHVYDDGRRDLAALHGLAHRVIAPSWTGTAAGNERAEVAAIAAAVADLAALSREIDRRARHLADLNRDLAAAGIADRVHRVQGLASLPLIAMQAAGIDLDRIDPDTAGMRRHVVVIGDAIRWIESGEQGREFADLLVRVAIRGRAAGVVVVIGTRSPMLRRLPVDLLDVISHRVAMRLRDPGDAARVLGDAAIGAGADATALTRKPMGQCWVTDRITGTYRAAQVYTTTPDRFAAESARLIRQRRRGGWLTGDALTTASKDAR